MPAVRSPKNTSLHLTTLTGIQYMDVERAVWAAYVHETSKFKKFMQTDIYALRRDPRVRPTKKSDSWATSMIQSLPP
jgi:hypothetical protein